ncbi:TraK oriT-binding protein [Tepidicaulis marinus]|uniref:TraK oriT-binding protein n=1 Tax=Tepidicaulis marinus TaxID=1333998 RepID=A0A081B676_9HYPH|nr:TraK oriT-binding protein [Tepidicaulis marinus]
MSMEWGQARVQIAALRDEIVERLEAGQTVKRIYEELKEVGRVSMTLRAFYVSVNRFRSEASQSTSPNQQRSASTTRQARSSENPPKPSHPSSSDKDADPVRATASLSGLRFDGPRSTPSSAPRIDDDLWGGSSVKTPGGSS